MIVLPESGHRILTKHQNVTDGRTDEQICRCSA